MKSIFENIIKAVVKMPENEQKYIFKQLKIISNEFVRLDNLIANLRLKISGVKKEDYEDVLKKAIDILQLFGFQEFTFTTFNEEFLEWFCRNVAANQKFNPKLMNYYLLTAMQQAWFLTKIESGQIEPEFDDVKYTLRNFNKENEAYKIFSKRELIDLLTEIHGNN